MVIGNSKRPLIWKDRKKDINMLWIWRICIMFTTTLEDDRKFGIWKAKHAIMLFCLTYGIGVGNSFGINNKAYER